MSAISQASARSPAYRPLLIADGLHASAARTPAKIAIRADGRALTYAALDERCRRVCAAAISSLGLRRADRVALFAPNCAEYPELMCGLSDAGAVVATINPRANAAELAGACADSGARALFVHPSLTDLAAAASCPGIERIIALGPDYESWLAAHEPATPDLPIEETDPFTLVYSSGTTGAPKGILLSHRSRVLTFHAMAMEYGCYGPDDSFLALTPLAHGAGFAFTMAALYFGGTVQIQSRFDPEQLLEQMAGGAFTGVFLVPTHFHAVFALEPGVLARYRPRARGRLKAIISNAAALAQPMKERIVEFWGAGLLHESYGSTEGGIVTNIRPDDQLRKDRSVGRPFATTLIRLLDTQGREVPAGEVGELYSRSPYLFSGYWNQPQATRECLHEGWVSAGDLARRDEEGFFYIVDRKKDMIVSGGINVFPREIEDALNRHAAVAESAVVGVPDAKWGERLRAFVVLRPDASASVEELVEHCRPLLSSYKLPREVRFIEALPRNAGGKILKKELRTLP